MQVFSSKTFWLWRWLWHFMYTETRRHRVFDYNDDDDDDFFGRASPSTSEGTRERRGEGTRTYLSEHKKCVTDRREVILLQPIVISHLRPHVLPLSHIYACLTTPWILSFGRASPSKLNLKFSLKIVRNNSKYNFRASRMQRTLLHLLRRSRKSWINHNF